MSTTQPRRPAGAPAGGQWAPAQHAEADVELPQQPVPAQAPSGPVSFADMDRPGRLRAMLAVSERVLAELPEPGPDGPGPQQRDSLRNVALVLLQRPDATLVTSARDWQEDFKRVVNRGELAIWALAACRYRTVADSNGDDDSPIDDCSAGEQERVSLRPVPLYDVSQTEGAPLRGPLESGLDVAEALSGWASELYGRLAQLRLAPPAPAVQPAAASPVAPTGGEGASS